MSADKVKFRRVVVPGDTLIIEAELTKMRGNIGQATARCLVNGDMAATFDLGRLLEEHLSRRPPVTVSYTHLRGRKGEQARFRQPFFAVHGPSRRVAG